MRNNSPDVVLTQDLCYFCEVDANTVRDAVRGLPVQPKVVVLQPRTLDEIFDSILQVGEACGAAEAAASLVDGLSGRVRMVVDMLASVEQRPSDNGRVTFRLIAEGGHSLTSAVGRHAHERKWVISELRSERGRLDDVVRDVVEHEARELPDGSIDMKWAPLPGALIMNRKTWDKIPEDLKPALMTEAKKFAVRLREETRRMDIDAVEAMQKRGLTVLTPSPEELKYWDEQVLVFYPELRGFYVSEEDFDWMQSVVEQVRTGSQEP